MTKKIRFIVNPFSGVGKNHDLKKHIERHLDHERYIWDIYFTEYPGHAMELAKKAAEGGYFMVVAAGGDGSVNEVAQALIGTKTVLGILPLGSGNGLAMHLGIGRNVQKAIRFLNEGQVLKIDSCLMNGKPYVNLAGLGFDANVATRIKGSRSRGFWGYFKFSVLEALSFKMPAYEIEINGEIIRRNCFALEVANAPMYGYGFVVAPAAVLNDGILEVMIIKKAPKWRILLEGWRLLTNSMHKSPLCERFEAKKVVVKTPEERTAVHIDGEGLTVESPVRFDIREGSLLVVCPKEYGSKVVQRKR